MLRLHSVQWLLMLVAALRMAFVECNRVNDLCFVCSCTSDYTTVDCSRRGLDDVPSAGPIKHLVKKLNFSNNEISSFPVSGLNNFYNLQSLDLSNNQLILVPENAFFNLTSLAVLNLSRNYFNSWLEINPNEAFLPTAILKILDLSNNKFHTMGNLANEELLISPSLETLILDNCGIDSIHGRSPLSGLINIRVLKLNHNPLLRIQGLMSPTLKSLYATNCQLNSLNHNELTYLPSLIYLKISHNYQLELVNNANTLTSDSIKYLDISYCNIMHPSLTGLPNLRKVLMNHNMIRNLRNNEFVNNSKLEYLDLSNNNIATLRSDTFRGLSMLKYLDLSWNEISNIPEDSLLEMPMLTQLKLARNYLTRVGHLKSTSISLLDMSYCEVMTLDKDSLEGLPSLIDLDLSRNLISIIPNSISSNTLKYLNLNYNRISSVGNYTLFMLPRLMGLSVIGNRFTMIWNKYYFESNPYLERLDLGDNMWRCDCSDSNMYDFYEFLTLEPNKKEESYNLMCNSPPNVSGQTWLEACFFVWNPSKNVANTDSVIWFIIIMIVGLSLCLVIVNVIKRSMKRRLTAIQAERERQVMEARDRLRQLRLRQEQEALCNAPDPRDLVAPPSYNEALSMPKLNLSCQSLCETGTGKTRRKRGRRKTKSSGDLLDETERNGDIPVMNDLELTEPVDNNRRRRRRKRYGSHEIAELEDSPGARRRRISEYNEGLDSVIVQVEAELERPLRGHDRRYSDPNSEVRESNF